MRKALSSAAVLASSAGLLVGAGTFSVFNDTATGSGTLHTGTVVLSLDANGAKTATLPLTPTCTLPFGSGQKDNLGTANNTDCTASVLVQNSGSLPFTLDGSSVTDTLVGGTLSCWTSTFTSGIAPTTVVMPGGSQAVTIKTANTNDASGCQGKVDTVTVGLRAFESRPSTPVILNGTFADGLTGWSQTNAGSGSFARYAPGTAQASPFTVPAAPAGSAATLSSQAGPGAHALYQDFVVTGPGVLSLDYYVTTFASTFITPNTLDYNSGANQQGRIDLIKPSANVFTMAPADILGTVLTTPAGPASTQGWTRRTFDLTPLVGQTVRLRVAEADNQGNFTIGVANVAIAPPA